MRPFAESPRHFSQNLRSSFLSSACFLPFSDAPGISSSDRTHEDEAPAIFILAQSRVWPTSLASVRLIKIPPDNLAFLKVVYYIYFCIIVLNSWWAILHKCSWEIITNNIVILTYICNLGIFTPIKKIPDN